MYRQQFNFSATAIMMALRDKKERKLFTYVMYLAIIIFQYAYCMGIHIQEKKNSLLSRT